MSISVEGIILSAGMSERAKAYKPMLPLGGKTVLAHCIDNMKESVSHIVVVCGYDAEKVEAITTGYPQVRTVNNPDFAKGMFTSVQVGCKQTQAEYIFLLPGDMPLVNSAVYEALLAVMRSTQADVLLPSHNGTCGHPVLMSRRVVESVCAANQDSNLHIELSQYPSIEVPVTDPGILTDLDTPADYDVMKQRFR